MGPYSYSSLSLLCRQVTRDNPDLPYPLTPDNVLVLGGPYTNSLGTSGRNARVVLNGKSGAGFVGRREFYYDRLDIGKVFNGITVVFAADSNSATYADLLPALNEQYGLGLEAADLSNGATKLTNGYTPTVVTLTIASTSRAYTGSLSVNWTRSPAGEYPESGPGTKLMLTGNLDAGYFGVVRAAEMASALDVFNALLGDDSTSSPVVNSNLFWLKFAYKGKFLYFPSTSIGTTTWKTLYDRGAVYGTDGTGLFPPAGSTPVAQNKVLAVDSPEGTVGFVPRLPTFALADPAPAVRAKDGELGTLLGRVFAGSYTTGDWDNLTVTEPTLDTTSAFMFQNAYAADGSNAWVTSMGVISTSSIAKTTKYAWRPFLALQDLSNTVLMLTDVKGTVVDRLRAPVMTIDQTRDPNIPVRVENVSGRLLRTISIPRVSDITAEPAVAVNSIKGRAPAGILRTPRMTIEVRPRQSLVSTNGDLDGFK